MWIADLTRNLGNSIREFPDWPLRRIYRKYAGHTMIQPGTYVRNLALAKRFRHIPGAVVECGVWKGGMAAGMAEVAGKDRPFYLFDSFEGLPPAQEIDGTKAKEWQANRHLPSHHNNSSADIHFSQEAMKLAGVKNCTITKGWFEQTLPNFRAEEGIAILRLDGDWYESTLTCLTYLYPQVNRGGVVIIDDYYAFEGCARAVHDYLSREKLGRRIWQMENDVCYLTVKDDA